MLNTATFGCLQEPISHLALVGLDALKALGDLFPILLCLRPKKARQKPPWYAYVRPIAESPGHVGHHIAVDSFVHVYRSLIQSIVWLLEAHWGCAQISSAPLVGLSEVQIAHRAWQT